MNNPVTRVCKPWAWVENPCHVIHVEPATIERYKDLEKRFDALVEKQRETIVKDQMDQLYTKNGGEFMNAFDEVSSGGGGGGWLKRLVQLRS